MGLLRWLFGDPPPHDDIADLREGLAAIIKRAMRDQNYLDIKVWNCSIRDIPVGSWHVVVRKIPGNEKEQGT